MGRAITIQHLNKIHEVIPRLLMKQLVLLIWSSYAEENEEMEEEEVRLRTDKDKLCLDKLLCCSN